MNNSNQDRKEQYNSIPVKYCKSCLSLHIESYLSDVTKYPEDEGIIDEFDYCVHCGSTDIATCTIQEYQEMYKKRYGHYPLETY